MQPGSTSSEDYISTTQNIWICASCCDVEAPYLFRLKELQETERTTGWAWKLSERFLQWTATTETHNNFAWETGISGTHRVCVKHPYNSSFKVAREALHHVGKDARCFAGNVYCSVQAVTLFLFSRRTIEARWVGVKANVSFCSRKTQFKLKAGKWQ